MAQTTPKTPQHSPSRLVLSMNSLGVVMTRFSAGLAIPLQLEWPLGATDSTSQSVNLKVRAVDVRLQDTLHGQVLVGSFTGVTKGGDWEIIVQVSINEKAEQTMTYTRARLTPYYS